MVDKRSTEETGSNDSLDSLSGNLVNKGKDEPKKVSVRISTIYLISGALWILLSDKILGFLVNDKEKMTNISMIKGWIYVVATGVLIFALVYSSLKRAKAAENELMQSYRDLTLTNRELEAAYGQLAASEEELRQQFEQTVQNQLKLKESEERYRLISEATNDAIWEEKNGVRYFSDRWFEITGYEKKDLELVGSWEDFIHPDDKTAAREIMLEHKRNGTPYYECVYRFRTKGGKYKWIRARGKAAFKENGEVYRMAGSHTDITELKGYEQKLHHFAYHDQLTGLLNRLSLSERLNRLTEELDGKKGALLFVDVDNFKYVNDTLGHTFGDMLLTKVSQRLVSLLEGNCNAYRLGGDEFVILVNGFSDIAEVEKLAVKILKGFKPRFEVGGSYLFTTVSIGISIYPDHGTGVDELLKNADIAVYKAKETGRNRIVVYNEPMNESVIDRMVIEKNLRTALENNEFELHYQPQLDIGTNRISGFEALIRWKSHELGFVSPLKFIEVAEDTHLIIPIGEWVLKNACLLLKKLQQQGCPDITISVNISMLQLLQDDFVDMVMEVLESLMLNPKHLELEITESILMESYETIAGKLKLLRGKGIRIALDDFGKGYSSLNYLKQLPISTLKIDKSFIDTISTDGKNKSLTDLIVKIGRSMELCVVAEGVETQEQMDYLVKHKCDKIQGYLFSRPVKENEVFEKIKEQMQQTI